MVGGWKQEERKGREKNRARYGRKRELMKRQMGTYKGGKRLIRERGGSEDYEEVR